MNGGNLSETTASIFNNRQATAFLFKGNKMSASDVGNFNAGYMGKAVNHREGISDFKLYVGAGIAEQLMKDKPDRSYLYQNVTTHDGLIMPALSPTFGDSPRDMEMNKKGMNYYRSKSKK